MLAKTSELKYSELPSQNEVKMNKLILLVWELGRHKFSLTQQVEQEQLEELTKILLSNPNKALYAEC